MMTRAMSMLISVPLALSVLVAPAQAATSHQGFVSFNLTSGIKNSSFSPRVVLANKKETASQRNAKNSAKSYLRYSSFSRSGLIQQLKFEGFSTKDATYGVDVLKVNWKQQAAKSAKSYLEYSSFSKSGLYDQLIFEGFTDSQASYGVRAAYK